MTESYLTVPTLLRGRFRLAVDADSPRLYRGAIPSATASMRDELLATSRQPELLIRFLAEIDRKLDAVLSVMQSETLTQEFPLEGHIVELSGYKVRFECDHALAEGAFIELLVMLEEYPMRIVSIMAQVEAELKELTLPCMHNHAYSIKFVTLEEEDREAIIRFAFSEERKRIRQQKGDG